MMPVGASPDLYQAAVNGAIMGAVIFTMYWIQKLMENRRSKYDMAVTLGEEIRLMLIVGTASCPIPIMRRNDMMPTDDVYRGMLSSGRIARFEGDLRVDLAQIYAQSGEETGAVDRNLCFDLIDRLEKIEARNRHFKLPG